MVRILLFSCGAKVEQKNIQIKKVYIIEIIKIIIFSARKKWFNIFIIIISDNNDNKNNNIKKPPEY